MSRWSKVLVASMCSAGAVFCASAAPQPGFDQEIASVGERAPLAPREALATLARIQADHTSLSTAQLAQVYEQSGLAKFYAKDFFGVLHDGHLLETLGKQNGDQNAECLGLLLQVYGNWKTGKIEAAYALVRRAGQFSSAAIRPDVRVRSLLVTAQLESEEHRTDAALHSVNDAVRLAATAHDDTLYFMATNTETSVALAANNMPLALTAVDRLLALARRAPYRERLVRAQGREFEVASAAGLTARASLTAIERIALMRQLRLNEVLGGALLDDADLQLKSSHYAEAADLSAQALGLAAVLADEQLRHRAHFNHAIANIQSGQVAQGEAEVERLFASTTQRGQLLAYLPDYVAALAQAGEVNASMQAAALRQQIEADEALHRAKEMEQGRTQIATLVNQTALKTREATLAHSQRNLWLGVAVSALAGLLAIFYLYRRTRQGNRALAASNLQLYTSSNRDVLTGLFNRRYVQNAVSAMQRRSSDSDAPVALAHGMVLLIDIDHFKGLNDSHGHAAGDQVLQATAARLGALFRNDDIVARWGGEEFLALLPNSHAAEASTIAARVLGAVSGTPFLVNGVTLQVTVSVGMCSLQLALKDRAVSWDEAVDLADQALYLAKQNGRDMAYAVTAAIDATADQLAQGLRLNQEQGKVALLEVFGASRQSAGSAPRSGSAGGTTS